MKTKLFFYSLLLIFVLSFFKVMHIDFPFFTEFLGLACLINIASIFSFNFNHSIFKKVKIGIIIAIVSMLILILIAYIKNEFHFLYSLSQTITIFIAFCYPILALFTFIRLFSLRKKQ